MERKILELHELHHENIWKIKNEEKQNKCNSVISL